MQLTDGAARLAAMTGSLLTKEEMIFRISFAYCRLFFSFFFFSLGWTSSPWPQLHGILFVDKSNTTKKSVLLFPTGLY